MHKEKLSLLSTVSIVVISYCNDLTVNCLDVHVAKDPDRVALIWEKDEPGTEERITYRYSSFVAPEKFTCDSLPHPQYIFNSQQAVLTFNMCLFKLTSIYFYGAFTYFRFACLEFIPIVTASQLVTTAYRL